MNRFLLFFFFCCAGMQVPAVSYAGLRPAAPVSGLADSLSIVLLSLTHDSCGLYEGAISIGIAGGIPPYEVLWSSDDTVSTLTGISGGLYQVSVTDATGLQAVSPVYTLNSPDTALQIADVQLLPVTCHGGNNGAIRLEVAGGFPPYMFQWDPVDSGAPSLDKIPAGDYRVTVTDIAGCEVLDTFALLQPDSFFVASIDKAVGPDGWSVSVQVSGGTPPYTAIWNPSAGMQNGLEVTGLPNGFYTVSIIDDQYCFIIIDDLALFPASLQDGMAGNLLSVAPVPADQWLRVSWDGLPGVYELDVFSHEGRLWRSIPVLAGAGRMDLPVSDWPSGVYVLCCRYPAGFLIGPRFAISHVR